MDQHYLNDEFDQFLKENADQHKMYPSDRVWANIKRQQHGDKRRVVYIGLFLLVAGSLLWLTVNPPAAYRRPVYSNLPLTVTQSKPTISVTVDDIIAKLRAKSLIPPMEIDAPVKLKPLGIRQRYFATLEDAMPVLLPPVTEPSPAREIAVNKPAPELPLEYHEITLPASDNQRLAGLDDPKIETYPGASRFDNEHRHEMTLPPIDLKKNRSSRLSVMMSFAPSIGYRSLFDGSRKITGSGNSPVMVQKLDVNEFVDHKPAIGFELGGHLKYELSKTITLRGGLQLNLARYNIQAFAHTLEKASLPINNAWGYQSDSLVVYSNIRNIAGNRPVQLKNQYLQVSLPVGAEMKLFGYSKFQVSLAGTLQPTYLLNADQYLLTNNFTNYAKEPSLIRRWNLATGLEAFFSYQRGDVRWQIGPQFRYNLLSTSNSEYPIRENLMEYGLKIGISRPLY